MQDTDHGDCGDASAIRITRRLDCPAEAVWAAITEADRIAAWWGDHVSLEAAAGGAFREIWRNEDGREVITSGKVQVFDPPCRLSLSWKDADWPVETHVMFRIAPDGTGVALTLLHEGWDRFASGGTALRQAHEAGWNHHLTNLATLLGAPL